MQPNISRDVVKRHEKTCQVRKAVVGESSSLDAPRQCDQCIRSGQDCSGEHPCLTCHDGACTYWAADDFLNGIQPPPAALTDTGNMVPRDTMSAAYETPAGDLVRLDQRYVDTFGYDFEHDIYGGSVSEDWPNATIASQRYPLITQYGSSTKAALEFFENQVNERGGLADKFVCGTKREREQALRQIYGGRIPSPGPYEKNSPKPPSHEYSEADAWASWVSCVDVMMSDVYVPSKFSQDDHAPDQLNLDSSISQDQVIEGAIQDDLQDDALEKRTHEIILRFKEVTLHRPRNSIIKTNWSADLVAQCRDFFKPANIRRYLCNYWLFWYPNSRIIHRPTFDASEVSVTLLLSIVLIGASVSPDDQDREKAKVWFDIAEEVVFGDEWLFEGTDLPIDTDKASWTRLEALQAAFQICVIQSWEGSDVSWRRIRRHRFTFVVAVSLRV